MSRRLTLLAAGLALGGLFALPAPATAAVSGAAPAVAAAVAEVEGAVVQVDGMARRRSATRSSSRRSMAGGRMSSGRSMAPRSGSDAAYMGGGAVYERGPDGSLRQVN